ncbi:MAG: DUF2752 domain-containing protein [Kiritimatiellae bacterium]|nr:DUF2752 domain-containing protein [Kiritimatiellia bacterium]
MALFFTITRPARRVRFGNTFAGNVFLLLFSGGALLLARLFPFDRFPAGFCLFLHWTGFPCPTCGFTRAFCDFARGNWGSGIHECPVAVVVYLAAVCVFLYNAFVVVAALFGRRVNRGAMLQVSGKAAAMFAVVFLLLLLANWIYRLGMGFK